MRVLGIDEAGRGCVLGSLYIGGFVADADRADALWAAGANDSKKLTAKKRLAIREQLTALGTADVRHVTATAIDHGNLNALEEAVIADLVREHEPDLVIVDALGHPKTLGRTLDRLRLAVHPLTPRWTMEPKADANHAHVAAASIFAKTERDAVLDGLREAWGELGSGYPSDPKTRAWLTGIARSGAPWPDFVRTRWGTIQEIVQQALF